MKKLINNFLSRYKTSETSEPLAQYEETEDDFGLVVDNNYGILTANENEKFDLDEKIYFSTKIELNRLSNNAFEKKFFEFLFDCELIHIKLIIAAKYDEVVESTHEHDIQLAKSIHDKAVEIFDREKTKFKLYASEHFREESLLMIKSMKAKNIIANTIEDIDMYIKTEWQTRKTKSYPAIVSKLALIEVQIMEEYKKYKIVPDTPPADDFLSEINSSDSKGHTTISFK